MDTLFIPLSLAAGAVLAVQAAANAQLAKAAGSPFAATTVQLMVAAVLLLLLTLLSGGLSALSLLPSAPWWHAIGGMASAFYVVSGILLFPRIGAVVSVGLFIAGQVLASTMLDLFGLLGVAATGLDLGVGIGAAMVMTGAALIVLGQKGAERGCAGAARLDHARSPRRRRPPRSGRSERAAQT
jgi:bacterial/archaeal transporter family-2 protein